MRNVVFWGSVPFLFPQALYVRKTAPRFPPAGGPPAGTSGNGEERRLLAIGDSIVAGVGASELPKALVGQTAVALSSSLDSRVSWQAIGVSGYNSSKVLARLVPKLPDVAADFIIVSVGVNDVTSLTTIPTWRTNLSLLLDKLQTHSPDARIAVAGMPPLHGFPLIPQPLRTVFGLRGRSFEESTREVVDRVSGAVHVPVDFEPGPDRFAGDGYHPSEASYAEFGRHMADALLGLDR